MTSTPYEYIEPADPNNPWAGSLGHFSVSVHYPASDPVAAADVYVLQVDHGVVTGYARLVPGATVTGEAVDSIAASWFDCGRYVCGTDPHVDIEAFAPGTFPVEYLVPRRHTRPRWSAGHRPGGAGGAVPGVLRRPQRCRPL